MSYVKLGEIPVASSGLLARTGGKIRAVPQTAAVARVISEIDTRLQARQAVSWYQLVPQLDIINFLVNNDDNARRFYRDVIQMWIDQDRGIPNFPGHEQGYKARGWDGSYGKLGTTWKGRFWDFSSIYGKAGAEFDPMRTSAVIVCLQRDPVHFAKVMGLVAGKNILRAVGLGEIPPVADPAAAQAAAAAAAASVPAPAEVPAGDPKRLESSQLAGIFSVFQEFMSFLSGMWEQVGPAVTQMFEQNTVPSVPLMQEVGPGPDQGAPEAKPFPILPVALGAGALAFLLLRK
jgi:hypothetical protein